MLSSEIIWTHLFALVQCCSRADLPYAPSVGQRATLPVVSSVSSLSTPMWLWYDSPGRPEPAPVWQVCHVRPNQGHHEHTSQAKLCPTNRPISYPPVPLSHAADMKASSIGGIWSLSLANRRQAKGPTNMQNLSGPEPADASEIHHPLVTEQAITTHSWSSVLNDKFPPLAFLRSMTISMSIKQKMCQKKKSQSIICVYNFFCCQKFSCTSTFYLSNLVWKFSTWSVSSSLWHLSTVFATHWHQPVFQQKCCERQGIASSRVLKLSAAIQPLCIALSISGNWQK